MRLFTIVENQIMHMVSAWPCFRPSSFDYLLACYPGGIMLTGLRMIFLMHARAITYRYNYSMDDRMLKKEILADGSVLLRQDGRFWENRDPVYPPQPMYSTVQTSISH